MRIIPTIFLRFSTAPRLVFTAGAAALLCLAQTSAPVPPADPVIHVSVNLVQVEAIVTDSNGRRVTGLKPEDFEITEDGKAQRITHLSYVSPARPATSGSSTSPGEPAPARKLRPEEIRRAMIFMLDDLRTTGTDLRRLRPVAQKFLDDQIAPGDLVSVVATGGGMGIYEQFTSDRVQLKAALDRVTQRVGVVNLQDDPAERRRQGDPAAQQQIDSAVRRAYGGDAPRADPINPQAEAGLGCSLEQMRFDAVMGKLTWAAQSLRRMPGRKSIVIFTDGLGIPHGGCRVQSIEMNSAMQSVAEQCNRSGVSIYSIDSRGLTDELSPGWENGALREASSYLTAETGGLLFRNTNDPGAALGDALEDMNGYYVIGFQPVRGDFDLKKGKVVYHDVRVKLRRGGYSIRHGRGFFGTPETNAPPPSTREAVLAEALNSPFDSGGIRVRLTPVYNAADSAPGTQKAPAMLRALLSIDGRGLGLTDGPDGRKKVVLDIVSAAYGWDNKAVAMNSKEYAASLTPAEVSELANGITWQSVVELPRPGGYQLRVAVRDGSSGAVGSANAFVVVPDFTKQELALSTLALSNPSGVGMMAQAALREFHPGSQAAYVCDVYGARGSVEIELHLFHDGTQVYASSPLTATPTAGLKRIEIAGRLNLAATLPDGEYQVELIARDPHAPRNQGTASQWTDLTLVRQADTIRAPHP